MIDDIGGVTSQLVKLAINAAVLRHEVIANNIANANTQGFKPQAVGFEQHMMNIEEGRTSKGNELLGNQIQGVQSLIDNGDLIQETGSAKVELDMEMKEMSENVLRYKAMLEGLSKRGSIIKMAINGQGGK